MTERMTDERLAEIEAYANAGFPNFEYSDRIPYWNEVYDALKAEREKVEELEAQPARECVWKPHDNWEEQYWSSSCGEDWAFTEGDPEENRVNFCQGCGGKVVIALNQREGEL